MPYRDDLEAARIRIAELESANVALQEDLVRARRSSAASRRQPWGWLVVGGIATLVLVGAGAGQVLYAQDHVAEQQVVELTHQLREAEADAATAREDRRVAFETVAHAYDQQQQNAGRVPEPRPDAKMHDAVVLRHVEVTPDEEDPRAALASDLYVTSDRPARVGIDGSTLYEWTPATISLAPGQHAVSVIADDGRVRRHTVQMNRGQPARLGVQFDR